MPAVSPLLALADGTPDGTGSTSTTRQVQASTPALVNGVSYLVLWDFGAVLDGSSDSCECDVLLGATELTFSSGRYEIGFNPPDASGNSAAVSSGMAVVTGNGIDTITVGTRRAVPGPVGVLFSGGGAVAIPLDGHVEGQDYHASPEPGDAWVYAPVAGLNTDAPSFTFTPDTTGPYLILMSCESTWLPGASATSFRAGRFVLVADPNGSPTETILGAGNNGGQLDPAFYQIAPDANPDTIVSSTLYPEVVALTAGVEYELRIDIRADGATTQYRRFRYVAVNGAAWSGFIQGENTAGLQVAAGNPGTMITIDLPDPGGTDDYVIVSGCTAANHGTWWRTYHEHNGVRFPDPGGFSNGGFQNGPSTSDDFFWVTGLDYASIAVQTDVELIVGSDLIDTPIGFAHGETSASPLTDEGTLSRLIGWRMFSDVVPSGTEQGAAVGSGSTTTAAAASVVVSAAAAGTGSTVAIASGEAQDAATLAASVGAGSTTGVALATVTVAGTAVGAGSTVGAAAGDDIAGPIAAASVGTGTTIAIAAASVVVSAAAAGIGSTTAIAAGGDAREFDPAAAFGAGSTTGAALATVTYAAAAAGEGGTVAIATVPIERDVIDHVSATVYTGRLYQGVRIKVR